MKRIIYILCLLTLAATARASIDSTMANVNLSTLTLNPAETLIVKHAIVVDSAYSTSTPALSMIFVRSGGSVSFAANSGFMCNKFVMGNRASAPFSSANGGSWIGLSTKSYLYIKSNVDGGAPYDIEIGPNSIVNISSVGGGVADYFMVFADPASYGLVRIDAPNASASITWHGVWFKGFYRKETYTDKNWGILIGESGRVATKTSIDCCLFDTTGITFQRCIGHKIKNSVFNRRSTLMSGAACFFQGRTDTLQNVTVISDGANLSIGEGYGLYAVSCDSSRVLDCVMTEQNTVPASSGNSYAVLFAASQHTLVHGCTFTQFEFTLAISDNYGYMTVDSCTFYTGTTGTCHEAIWLKNNSDHVTISRCVFATHASGGQSPITFYPTTDAPDYISLLYNTFLGSAPGGTAATSAVAFESYGAATMTYNNVVAVGNIFCNNNTYSGADNEGIYIGPNGTGTVRVNFSVFKNNAYNKIRFSAGSSASYEGASSPNASNKLGVLNYAFQDSAHLDFRLGPGSPMLNCGEDAYYDQLYPGVNPPGDIGYHQTNLTGVCGSTVPTGACCYESGTCAEVTYAQCIATPGAEYSGDGVPCASVNCPQPPNPNVGHPWIQTAMICYGIHTWDAAVGKWLANKYDMLINPNSTVTNAVKANTPNLPKWGPYTLTGTIYPGNNSDSLAVDQFEVANGLTRGEMYLHAGPLSSDTIILNEQLVGSVDHYDTTFPGQKLKARRYGSDRYVFDQTHPLIGPCLWAILKSKMDSEDSIIFNDEDPRITNSQYGGPLVNENGAFPWDSLISYGGGRRIWIKGNNSNVVRYDGTRWNTVAGYDASGHGSGSDKDGDSLIADSIVRRGIQVNKWGALNDSIATYGYQYFGNTTTYFDLTDSNNTRYAWYGTTHVPNEMQIASTSGALSRRIGVTIFEPLTASSIGIGASDNRFNWKGFTFARAMADSVPILWWAAWSPYDSTVIHAAEGGNPMPRIRMTLLSEYYCWANKDYSWLMLKQCGHNTNNDVQPYDTLQDWTAAINVNIGTATDSAVKTTGYDPIGAYYMIWKRSYSNGVAVWRQPIGSNFTHSGDITFSLGGSYYEVSDDGSVSATPSTSGTFANSQGRLYVSTVFFDTTLTVSGGAAAEGQPGVFEIRQNRTLNARNYFSFSTLAGSATAGVDYTSYGEGSGQIAIVGSIGPGELSTTISVPTTDDIQPEGNETFSGVISGPSYGTIITASAPWIIMNNDQQTQPGRGQRYKGWSRKQP